MINCVGRYYYYYGERVSTLNVTYRQDNCVTYGERVTTFGITYRQDNSV